MILNVLLHKLFKNNCVMAETTVRGTLEKDT